MSASDPKIQTLPRLYSYFILKRLYSYWKPALTLLTLLNLVQYLNLILTLDTLMRWICGWVASLLHWQVELSSQRNLRITYFPGTLNRQKMFLFIFLLLLKALLYTFPYVRWMVTIYLGWVPSINPKSLLVLREFHFLGKFYGKSYYNWNMNSGFLKYVSVSLHSQLPWHMVRFFVSNLRHKLYL
jgi:hypothetical protein